METDEILDRLDKIEGRQRAIEGLVLSTIGALHAFAAVDRVAADLAASLRSDVEALRSSSADNAVAMHHSSFLNVYVRQLDHVHDLLKGDGP